MLLASTILSLSAHATERTVSNNLNSPGQFQTVLSAINAGTIGDTIYITPSPYTYDSFTFPTNKSGMILIGGGYNNSDLPNNLSSIMGSLSFINGSGANFSFSGLQIAAVSTSNAITNVNNYVFKRCYIPGLIQVCGSGWTFENCVLINFTFLNQQNVSISNTTVRNCFIAGNITGSPMVTATNQLFYHNIIEGKINSLPSSTFIDNVFFFANVSASTGTTNCVFNNNLTYNTTADVVPFNVAGGNSGSNNYIKTIADGFQFNNNLAAVQAYPALLSVNWTINPSSQGHNGATDGTDAGIYGGFFPLVDFSGATGLPQMTFMNVTNTSILANGTLNVQFKARKHN